MKRIAITLLLFISLTFAIRAEPYFPGAWYATKGPGGLKQAGAIEVFFFNDNALEFDIYIGGGFLETVSGTYIDTGKFLLFTIVDSEGWTWEGKMNLATGQLTGKFVSGTGLTKGKFQATQEDDGISVAASPDKKARRQPTK